MAEALEVAIAMVFLLKVTSAFVERSPHAGSPGRLYAGVLWLVVAIPSFTQGLWPQLLTALRRDPEDVRQHSQWWRLVTALVVQDGGLFGTAFNLVTLALVVRLASLYWGGIRMWAIFLGSGVALNLLAVDYDSTGAGNSGATFALLASVVGAGAVFESHALRWRAAGALVVGTGIWALGNTHGIAVAVGGAVGWLVSVMRLSKSSSSELRLTSSRGGNDERPSPGGAGNR